MRKTTKTMRADAPAVRATVTNYMKPYTSAMPPVCATLHRTTFAKIMRFRCASKPGELERGRTRWRFVALACRKRSGATEQVMDSDVDGTIGPPH